VSPLPLQQLKFFCLAIRVKQNSLFFRNLYLLFQLLTLRNARIEDVFRIQKTTSQKSDTKHRMSKIKSQKSDTKHRMSKIKSQKSDFEDRISKIKSRKSDFEDRISKIKSRVTDSSAFLYSAPQIIFQASVILIDGNYCQ
jgi:hypothetical protein